MVNKIKFYTNKRCIINNTKDLVSLIKLPNYPLTEQFGKFNNNFPNLDQELVISKSSGHVQLKYIPDQSFIYSPKNYKYRTKISHSTNSALKVFISFLKRNHKLKIKSILDIGGNDNYIINKISNKNTKKYVIDPVAKILNDGVIVINKFLEDVNLSKDIKQPDIVICRHTLEHIPNPKKFLKKILSECRSDCKFIFEVPSLERMIETYRFDTIMHQHVSYFSVRSLKLLIAKCGGKLTSYEIYNTGSCGGSILFSFKKINNLKKKISKLSFAKFQREYKIIKKKITIFKNNMKILRQLIQQEEYAWPEGRSGMKLIGYGAGLMLSTFMYFLNISAAKIKYILDDDIKKHNTGYQNIKVKIKHPEKVKFQPGQNYLITSLENKKKLISKILLLEPNYIYFPSPA
jgi:cyclopropane-fatty-acyl-phospholipid synthase